MPLYVNTSITPLDNGKENLTLHYWYNSIWHTSLSHFKLLHQFHWCGWELGSLISMIINPPLATTFSLNKILLHDHQIKKQLYLKAVLKPNIEALLLLLLRFHSSHSNWAWHPLCVVIMFRINISRFNTFMLVISSQMFLQNSFLMLVFSQNII